LVYRDVYFFFFSSRRRHTRCYRDWSSDVCSSDLAAAPIGEVAPGGIRGRLRLRAAEGLPSAPNALAAVDIADDGDGRRADVARRSEERRVGKECRSRGWR